MFCLTKYEYGLNRLIWVAVGAFDVEVALRRHGPGKLAATASSCATYRIRLLLPFSRSRGPEEPWPVPAKCPSRSLSCPKPRSPPPPGRIPTARLGSGSAKAGGRWYRSRSDEFREA